MNKGLSFVVDSSGWFYVEWAFIGLVWLCLSFFSIEIQLKRTRIMQKIWIFYCGFYQMLGKH